MGKSLRIMAQIATICMLIVAVLAYCGKNDDAITQFPEAIQGDVEEEVESKRETLSPQIYEGSEKPAWLMYQAALLHSSISKRNDALRKALNVALGERDFELSLIIVAEISSISTRNSELVRIADAALESEESRAYAVMAAELISSLSTRADVLDKVIQSYDPNN